MTGVRKKERWNELEDTLQREIRGRVLADEPMARHTWIGVGGPARLFVSPRSVAEVCTIVRITRDLGVKRVTVGRGSNLIVRDGGYDGVVVEMGKNMARVTVNKRTVRAQGGASFARLCRNLTRGGRRGMEFGIGIPGTVGGAVRMNAGAFGGEVCDVLRRVWVVRAGATVSRLEADEIEFGYRRTSLPRDDVVVAATFDCPPGQINREAYQRALARKETQPIDERTFGSTFVNPTGGYAAAMIESCGLKGRRIGGAMISPRHANFIVNPDGEATAADVEALIELMRTKVKKKHGVDLKTEVVVIGNR